MIAQFSLIYPKQNIEISKNFVEQELRKDPLVRQARSLPDLVRKPEPPNQNKGINSDKEWAVQHRGVCFCV